MTGVEVGGVRRSLRSCGILLRMMQQADAFARGLDAAHAPFILVLDIGSSSTRAVLFDATASMIPGTLVREKSAFHVAPDGTATDDPAAILQRVTRCIDAVLAAAGPYAEQIAAVGSTTYAANLLGLDPAGHPCTPVFTYADTRSDPAADELRLALNEAAILQRTGCPLRTSYWPAMLRWLAHQDPQLARGVHRWSNVGEWLFETFLGRSILTYSFASWTGLLNRTTLDWDGELLNELSADAEQFGSLADVDHPISGLRSMWAERWPALAAVPWFSAIGDGAAANLGSGCVDGQRIALSVGTSGALRAVLPKDPPIPPGLWCYRVDRHRPLLGGATSEGGNVLTWALQTLQLDAPSLNATLLTPDRAGHRLVVLPFVAGERSPGWSGAARATITGIGTATTALDVARAALEGVTYRWAAIAALLRPALGEDPLVVASGGGLKHVPAWGQLISDALGLSVAISSEPETTSRGVALVALRSLGLIATFGDRQLPLKPAYHPDPQRHAWHQEARVRQAELYRRLQDYA